VTRAATKHVNVNFLTWIWGIFLHTSHGVEGWHGIGWLVGFDGFQCFFLFVIIGARNKLGSTLFTFILTSLKTNPQFVCEFGCTLLNSTQILPNHFLTHNGSLKTFSSSSKPDESSLEKSKSLKAAHAQDMIFLMFFFLLSPKQFFFV
jgi:hypothetical protein